MVDLDTSNWAHRVPHELCWCILGGAPLTIVPVPNKPKTPVSSFRIPLDLKARVQAKAAANGTDLTAIVIAAFEKYDKAK